MINQTILEGKIVPVAITVDLLKNAMELNGWDKKQFLIDGFPRNQDNLDGWQSVMKDIANVECVLFAHCT